jgi:hypothetical protein
LAGVHALVGDEGLGVELVSVWVAENDLGEWCAAAGIVDNVLYNTTNVSMALSEIVGAELGGGLVQALMRVLVYRSFRTSRLVEVCVRVFAVKMDPRPFLWLRITRP